MNRIKSLREQIGMTQAELGKLLNVRDAAISKYESGKVPLTGETLLQLSKIFNTSIDYILGNDDFLSLSLGYSDKEEEAVTFPHKLLLQLDYSGHSIKQLSEAINVPETEIMEWIDNKNDTYQKYYKKLSSFFDVSERYWTSPGALSPTIEPDIEEHMLLTARRYFLENNNWSPYDAPLSSFFPGIAIADTPSETKMLDAFKKLDEDNQDIIIGRIKELLKEQASSPNPSALDDTKK